MTPTCHFTKGDGSRCGAVAVTESDFCYHHQEHYRRRRKIHNTFLGKSKVLEPFMSGAAAGRDPVTKRVYDALFADAVDALDLPPFDPPGDPVAVALTSILHLIATQQVERSITQQMLYTVRLAIANRDRLAAHAAKQAAGENHLTTKDTKEHQGCEGTAKSPEGTTNGSPAWSETERSDVERECRESEAEESFHSAEGSRADEVEAQLQPRRPTADHANHADGSGSGKPQTDNLHDLSPQKHGDTEGFADDKQRMSRGPFDEEDEDAEAEREDLREEFGDYDDDELDELRDELSPPTPDALETRREPVDSVVQDVSGNGRLQTENPYNFSPQRHGDTENFANDQRPTTNDSAKPKGGYVHKDDAWYEKKACEAEEYARETDARYLAKATKVQDAHDERTQRRRQQRAIMKGEFGETG